MDHRRKVHRRTQPWPMACVVLVTLLAFGLRAGSLTAQSFWRDEVDALCYAFEFPRLLGQALVPERAGELITPCACPPLPVAPEGGDTEGPPLARLARTLAPMIQQNGPLYFFLLRGWISVVGHGEYGLRFFSVWFGVLSVPFVYALGRRLLGKPAGLLTSLLHATSPYLVWYGQEVKMYTVVPALVLLALYALRRAVDSGARRWWAVQIVATSLAFYIHIWSALLVPVQAVLLLVWWPRWRRQWREALVSLAALTLPYLPLALWQIPSAFTHRATGFARHTLANMALILLNGWSMGITARGAPWGAVACAGAILLATAAGLAGRARAPGQRETLGLVGWLAVPLAGIWFISRWQPLFTDRYLIWTAPAFYLLAGAGLALLWRWRRWPAIAGLAAVLFIFAANLRIQATVPIKSDVRRAVAHVEEAYRPGDLLLFQIPHMRYTFDYYFEPREFAWVDGLYTNHRTGDGEYLTTEEAAGLRMGQITWGYQTLWLIASEVPMWDERGLVQEWLEANGQRVEEAHFAHVDVYRYRLGEQR